MRKHARPRSRSEWEALVREWRSGSLTQKEFARRKGIPPATLSWWSCRLRREAAAAFLPVEVVDAQASPAADFRIELRAGRMLHVPASFDAAALRRLLAVLEDAAC